MCVWPLTLAISCANPCQPIVETDRSIVFACDSDAYSSLSAAYARGHIRMVYIHDSSPRVVARPGKKKWVPRGFGKVLAGPRFAGRFIERFEYR